MHPTFRMHPSRPDAVRSALTALTVLALVASVLSAPASARVTTGTTTSTYRAYPSTSYWNQPLPADAPIDPRSREMIAYLANDSAENWVQFSGTAPSGSWGNPIYWAKDGDPTYRMTSNCPWKMPPEFDAIRIPRGARPDPTSDAAMTVYDVGKGLVYATHRTTYDAANDRWTACGGTVGYLGSNGLDGKLPQSNHSGNRGHRGVPPPTYAVRWDEIKAGRIDHVLKIAVNTTKCEHVFPMVGDECGTTDANALPEGARIRIKRSVDLSKLGLSPAALTVARALKRYGAVVGDQSGGATSLKVENTVAQGRGQLWTGVLDANSLRAIPLSSFEVIRLGYGS